MSQNAKNLIGSDLPGIPAGVPGLTIKEVIAGGLHTVYFSFNQMPVTVANTSGASFGSQKLYTYREGRIYNMGGFTKFPTISWVGEDIGVTGSGDYSLGTTATADATLSTTDVDVQASTAMLDPFVDGVGSSAGAVFATPAAFDGTGTAKEIHLNVIIDDADVSDGASDIVLFTGSGKLVYAHFGDL
jgi:hypothetical protein